MEHKCILLDTNFLIRLLNEHDDLHKNTVGYYRYFVDNQFILKCSTISIAEYCVKGTIDELPLRDLQILPFNVNHAKRAGELAKFVFANKNTLNLSARNIIPNDTKLFAQADSDNQIDSFATADEDCLKIFRLLQSHMNITFEILDIRIPFTEAFGLLFDS